MGGLDDSECREHSALAGVFTVSPYTPPRSWHCCRAENRPVTCAFTGVILKGGHSWPIAGRGEAQAKCPPRPHFITASVNPPSDCCDATATIEPGTEPHPPFKNFPNTPPRGQYGLLASASMAIGIPREPRRHLSTVYH